MNFSPKGIKESALLFVLFLETESPCVSQADHELAILALQPLGVLGFTGLCCTIASSFFLRAALSK
jgi:hypothetical protein